MIDGFEKTIEFIIFTFEITYIFDWQLSQAREHLRESITVQLTSCLASLEICVSVQYKIQST